MSLLRCYGVAQVLSALAFAGAAAQQPHAPGAMGRGMGPGQQTEPMSMPMPMGPMGMGGGMMMGAHDPEMMRIHAYSPAGLLEQKDRLALTPTQATRLDALAKEVDAAAGRSKVDHEAHHVELLKLFQQPAPDAAQVKAHAQAAVQADRDAHVALLVAVAQAKTLLTAEQRARVEGWADAREMMQADMSRRRASTQGEHDGMQH